MCDKGILFKERERPFQMVAKKSPQTLTALLAGTTRVTATAIGNHLARLMEALGTPPPHRQGIAT